MNFKDLLGDSVSDDVIYQLEEGLQLTIESVLAEKEDEIQHIKEKAEKFAEFQCNEILAEKNAEIADLKEKANEYGEAIYESVSMETVEYVEKIADLKEKANEYGEAIRNEIMEKADEYTQQFIEEYQAKHSAMYESIQEENTAKDVLENIKYIIESFGYSVDQNTAIANLKESLDEQQRTIDELNSKLYENDISKQKELILEKATKNLSLNEKQKIIEASKDILTESITGFEKVVNIMASRFNSNSINTNDNILTEKNNKIINTNNNDDKNMFEKTYSKTKSAQEIAKSII